jgi:hypothetical protein
MNDETTTLDQADEDILTPIRKVSDDALEAAAGTGADPSYFICTPPAPQLCR